VVALGLAALLAGLASCGERSFEAEEFVEEVNANGGALELGEPLPSTEPDTDVYALRPAEGASPAVAEEERAAEEHTAEEPAVEEHGHEHVGGGSLTVVEDAEAALAKYRTCERAVTLICYRAANVVMTFEGLTTEQRSRLDSAVRALAE
jgi:hypothetical protein